MNNQATVLTAISLSEAVDTCILDSLSFVLVKIGTLFQFKFGSTISFYTQ